MNVLVTRPEQSGQALTEMLNAQHIFAMHLPLFRLEAGAELPLLPSILTQLNAGDYVFSVSKHAADFAAQTLTETGFHWRSDLRYFSVGRSSARYFSEQIERNVHFPITSENSEGVLALPEMQQLDGKKVVILRAETGRNLLAEQAIARGATVQYVACYQRVPLTENMSDQISLCKRAGVDTIVATSGEILTTLCEQTALEDLPWLFECRLLVVSQRLARLAQQLGWQRDAILLSEKADNSSLFERLTQHAKSGVSHSL